MFSYKIFVYLFDINSSPHSNSYIIIILVHRYNGYTHHHTHKYTFIQNNIKQLVRNNYKKLQEQNEIMQIAHSFKLNDNRIPIGFRHSWTHINISIIVYLMNIKQELYWILIGWPLIINLQITIVIITLNKYSWALLDSDWLTVDD